MWVSGEWFTQAGLAISSFIDKREWQILRKGIGAEG
jgi:hypothetical protein